MDQDGTILAIERLTLLDVLLNSTRIIFNTSKNVYHQHTSARSDQMTFGSKLSALTP
jgi:hypothetical protein